MGHRLQSGGDKAGEKGKSRLQVEIIVLSLAGECKGSCFESSPEKSKKAGEREREREAESRLSVSCKA